MAVATAPAPKSGLLTWVIAGVVCLAAVGGGVAVPFLLDLHPENKQPGHTSAPAAHQPALVPFGDAVVVNLAEERLSRYLRVKLMLVVDGGDEESVKEALQKKKVFLRNWLLSYLSDQTIRSITGAVGQNRVRREVRDQFNAILFSDGSEKITDILFEEFNVQ